MDETVNPADLKLLTRFLDTSKKGMISFADIMEFITDYSEESKYPEPEDIIIAIATKLINSEKKTMKEYIENLNIGVTEFIPVSVFVDTIMKPFEVSRKDSYYLYGVMKDANNKNRVNAATLINTVEDRRVEIIKSQEAAPSGTLSPQPEQTPNKSQEVSKQEISKQEIVDTGDLNRPLAAAVLDLYNILFSADSTRRMNEKTVFKLFDTDENSYLSKAEFIRGLKKLKLNFTPEQVNEIIEFADKDKSGTISLSEFLEMVKLARSNVVTKKIEDEVKNPEELYLHAITKLKNFVDKSKETFVRYDYKFLQNDEKNEGVLSIPLFEDSLRNLRVGLSEEEIQIITLKADKNKDGVINYEEFIEYLETLSIKELPEALANLKKKEVKKAEEKPVAIGDHVREVVPEILQNVKTLCEKTNFGLYDKAPRTFERLAGEIETPYEDFVINPDKHFGRVDVKTKKYKATIVTSRKAAVFSYFL